MFNQILVRYWWRHLLVLVVAIVLVNLGQWQLRRLEQRRALNQEITKGLDQPSVTLTGDPVDPEALHRRRVVVTGTFENEENIALRNRSFEGRPGVELIVPLRIKGSDQAVLVNRGWIPLQISTAEERMAYALEGEVTVEGIAYRSQPRPDGFLVPTDPTPVPGQKLDTWFRVDIERIQQQVDKPLLPIFVQQSAPPAGPAEPPLPQKEPELTEGSHLGYAFQWFSFAFILLVMYSAFVWQEAKRTGG